MNSFSGITNQHNNSTNWGNSQSPLNTITHAIDPNIFQRNVNPEIHTIKPKNINSSYITNLLANAHSSAEVLAIYRHNPQLFDLFPHVILIAISRLTDLRTTDKLSNLRTKNKLSNEFMEIFESLINKLLLSMNFYNSGQIATLSRNLAKLKGCDEEFFQPYLNQQVFLIIANAAVKKIQEFTPSQTLSIAWAFSTAKMPFIHLFEAIQLIVNCKIEDYSSNELISIFKSFVKLQIGYVENRFYLKICDSIETKIRLGGQENEILTRYLTDLVWCLAVSEIRHEKLLERLANKNLNQISRLNTENLAIFAWSLAALDFENEGLLETFSITVQNLSHEYINQPQLCCILFMTFRAFRLQIPSFLSKPEYKEPSLIRSTIKNILFGNVFTKPLAISKSSTDIVQNSPNPFLINKYLYEAQDLQTVFDLCDHFLNQMNGVNITTALRNLFKLSKGRDPFPLNDFRVNNFIIFSNLIDQGSHKIHTFKSQELSLFAHSLLNLKVNRPDLYDKIAEMVIEKIDSFDYQEITAIVSTFSKANLAINPLILTMFSKIIPFIESNTTKFPLREMGTILKYLAILNIDIPRTLLQKITESVPKNLNGVDLRIVNDYKFAFNFFGIGVEQLQNLGLEEIGHEYNRAEASSRGSLSSLNIDETPNDKPVENSVNFNLQALVAESQQEMIAELKTDRDLINTLNFCDTNMQFLETAQIPDMFKVIAAKFKAENKHISERTKKEQSTLERLHEAALKSIHFQKYNEQQLKDLRMISAQLGLPFKVFGERLAIL